MLSCKRAPEDRRGGVEEGHRAAGAKHAAAVVAAVVVSVVVSCLGGIQGALFCVIHHQRLAFGKEGHEELHQNAACAEIRSRSELLLHRSCPMKQVPGGKSIFSGKA